LIITVTHGLVEYGFLCVDGTVYHLSDEWVRELEYV